MINGESFRAVFRFGKSVALQLSREEGGWGGGWGSREDSLGGLLAGGMLSRWGIRRPVPGYVSCVIHSPTCSASWKADAFFPFWLPTGFVQWEALTGHRAVGESQLSLWQVGQQLPPSKLQLELLSSGLHPVPVTALIFCPSELQVVTEQLPTAVSPLVSHQPLWLPLTLPAPLQTNPVQ